MGSEIALQRIYSSSLDYTALSATQQSTAVFASRRQGLTTRVLGVD